MAACGVQFTASGMIFTNTGTVTGGNGGAGGSGPRPGNPGAGGAGIVGGGLTIINSGTISGGLSGDGVTRANAITFTGGTNILELQAGYNFIGNVVAFSSADTLRLGGTSNASFDVSQIGAQYLGFGIFQKIGSSTWTLTGTNAAALPWAINAGTLVVNGTMANSTMTVNGGSTLAGTGTVAVFMLAHATGIFAPGPCGHTRKNHDGGRQSRVRARRDLSRAGRFGGCFARQCGGHCDADRRHVQAAFAPGSCAHQAARRILHALGDLGGTEFSGVMTIKFTSPASAEGRAERHADRRPAEPQRGARPGDRGSARTSRMSLDSLTNSYFNNGGALLF